MGKFIEILRLTRIEHSAMLVIAVLAAELIVAGRLPSYFTLAMSLVTPIFISMAAFAVNDYFDIKVDTLNKKKRPLVTGKLKPADAIYVTVVSMAIGIAASAFINAYCLAIAIIFGALALLYSYKFKEMLFWGNAYIAFSMVIPFIFGNYVVSDKIAGNIVIIGMLIFFSGLAREIHGSIRDLKGDISARAIRSIPKVVGVGVAATIAFVLYLIAIIISFYLFLYIAPFRYSLSYIILISVTDIILFYSSLVYMTKRRERFYSRIRNISLVAMGIALLAMLITPIVPLSLAHI